MGNVTSGVALGGRMNDQKKVAGTNLKARPQGSSFTESVRVSPSSFVEAPGKQAFFAWSSGCGARVDQKLVDSAFATDPKLHMLSNRQILGL